MLKVADDFRQAAQGAHRHIEQYVEQYQATGWTLRDCPKTTLFLAADPTLPPGETADEETARARLQDLDAGYPCW